jgi:LPS sulfotransferase NodH
MRPFESFVVLGEMRTGSNLLETQLNKFPGLTCHPEVFNPLFIGKPELDDYLGVTFAQREEDPFTLLSAIRAGGGLTGFRLFSGHDPRIRQHVLADPTCAKIVLTRNPLESYLSLRIAIQTDQWKLGDVREFRRTQVPFDPEDFDRYLHELQESQLEIQRALQTTGQTAFWIHYEDIQDVDILNGLARWLGITHEIRETAMLLKKQNPGAIEEKVTNPAELAQGLARIDRFDLRRTPNLEPRRDPMLAEMHACPVTPLLFMPLRGAMEHALLPWLADLDGVEPQALLRGFTQPRLRDWKTAHPGFRSFTVLRDPLLRAHRAFCQRVLSGEFTHVREHMARLFDVDLGTGPVTLDLAAHRTAFKVYLRFVAASIGAQSALRPWPIWASQSALLEAFSRVGPPDHIFREETLTRDLGWLLGKLGITATPAPPREPPWSDLPLHEVFDDETRALCHAAYARDYQDFGFRP